MRKIRNSFTIELSIVIVNYNVKYFLEQTLRSVEKAVDGIQAEIFVVDNASHDGSVAMVRQKFPQVKVIANEQNVGFSKANNQAIRQCTGEHVLLLNPDTVVEESSFSACLQFMKVHPEAGALGVRMIDGQGKFLPESKRAFPSPSVAFYKIFGLTALFPKSKTFARYYLGHLSEHETHQAEVLSGAFMWIRKTALDKCGLLDEDYFMYGEDIDLSYRIVQGGFTNYYFAGTSIIHYKGESTKKGSLNYIRIFYKAMQIFANKHLSGSQAALYNFFINLAIYARALLSLLSGAFSKIAHPALDGLLTFGGLFYLADIWATGVKATESYYPDAFIYTVLPAYSLIWVGTSWFSGCYDYPAKVYKILKGVLFGTLFIAAIYAFLPNELRFSRALILLGTLWTIIAMLGTRFLKNLFKYRKWQIEDEENNKLIVIGEGQEAERVLSLLKQSSFQSKFIGFVSSHPSPSMNGTYLGDISALEDIVEVYDPKELVFCGKDVGSNQIISQMSRLGQRFNYKIVPEKSIGIIGSNSRNKAGELFAIDVNLKIDQNDSKRNKRLFDIIVCVFMVPAAPLWLFNSSIRSQILSGLFKVPFGNASWIGYTASEQETDPALNSLPQLKPGIFSLSDAWTDRRLTDDMRRRMNLIYARDYSIEEDCRVLWKVLWS